MRKSTIVTNCINAIYSIVLVFAVSSTSLFGQCDPGTLSGDVFIDEDLNGSLNGQENGYSGIIVRAYDASGNVAGQTLTANNGSYTISGLSNGVQYMVTFNVPLA